MANLTPVNSNDPVFQLETTTVALGGAGQVMNAQAQALLNRLTYETARAIAAENTLAPLASPQFTGAPLVIGSPPVYTTNTTQLATTAFVQSVITNEVAGVYAPINNPILTGDPQAPTPAFGDSDTSIATTAFVQAAVNTSVFNAQTGTTYTLVLTDAGLTVTGNNASPITFTVPLNASVAFPVGTNIDLIQKGAGKLTVAGAGGVTINSLAGNKSAAGQYSGMTLRKEATDTWYLLGSLIA
jgi:hypothetical protein